MRNNRRYLLLLYVVLGCCLLCYKSTAQVKIATLHPIFSDMAQAIGGEHVQIFSLLHPNGDLHRFEPSTKDLARAGQCRFVLASGKNLEPYLPELHEALGSNITIVELGTSIPDVPIDEHATHTHVHVHGEHCHHGPNDPHWWHTPNNMKRAARMLAQLLCQHDPAHQQSYKDNLTKWNREMDRLSAWARQELAQIPEQNRILVTGHAAMAHFCHEFGFRNLSVQGISRQGENDMAQQAKLFKQLRALHIRVLFPEFTSSPKTLQEISQSLHIPMAKPLNTDGLLPTAHTFPAMFKQNVLTIKEALSPTIP